MSSPQTAPLIPAATVLLARDSAHGLEVLMLRRNSALRAFGGAWVFPGGRVDTSDGTENDSEQMRARYAAVRETLEETGLKISPDALVSLSLWIPPAQEKRRFSTHFFITKAPDSAVIIDAGEIHDFQWVQPQAIISSMPNPDMPIMPPTYISLLEISSFSRVNHALEHLSARPDDRFETRFARTDSGFVTLWQPDAAYDCGDLSTAGPRHRLTAGPDNWHYERKH